ncbi:Uncharacterised protein [uncultured archaeon]|nr:Uncharacterised protein [uncultured archaeon]
MTRKEIPLCPICGSRDITSLSQTQNWAKQSGTLMGLYTCRKCGHQGLPLILDSEEDYAKYMKIKRRK